MGNVCGVYVMVTIKMEVGGDGDGVDGWMDGWMECGNKTRKTRL